MARTYLVFVGFDWFEFGWFLRTLPGASGNLM